MGMDRGFDPFPHQPILVSRSQVVIDFERFDPSFGLPQFGRQQIPTEPLEWEVHGKIKIRYFTLAPQASVFLPLMMHRPQGVTLPVKAVAGDVEHFRPPKS
jgi:hypothetical protein